MNPLAFQAMLALHSKHAVTRIRQSVPNNCRRTTSGEGEIHSLDDGALTSRRDNFLVNDLGSLFYVFGVHSRHIWHKC